MSIIRRRVWALPVLGAVIVGGLAAPATAGTRTRLVECENRSCLLVTGRRASTATGVAINGHAVAVQGARKWQVSLPIDTVRRWSAPLARTISVSVGDNHVQAALPIGLLGHAKSLAILTVSAK